MSAQKIASFLKILDLEARRDYSDKAVIGGLDRFLEISAAELAEILGKAPVGVGGYAGLSHTDRRSWIQQIRGLAPSPPVGSGRPATTAKPPRATPEPPAAKRPLRAAPSRPTKGKKPSRDGKVKLQTHIDDLSFIRRPTAIKMDRLGVKTLYDLLYLFPSRHIDYSTITAISELEFGQTASVIGHVVRSSRKRIGRGAAFVVLSDNTGIIEATWFNQAYLADRFKPGTTLALSGKVQAFREKAQFQNPEYEIVSGGADELVHAGVMLPVYPTTEGLPQRTLRNATSEALEIGLPLLKDPLPAEIRTRHGFQKLTQAVHDMHLPGSPGDTVEAQRRLAFDELFVNQLAVQRRRLEWQDRSAGVAIPGGRGVVDRFIASLPFRLTADQESALNEILAEMSETVPMARLLQGEVGSGKTVVAVTAMLAAVAAGYQGALLAPTEVLADQHFINITRMLGADTDDAFNQGVIRTANVPGLEKPVRIAVLEGSLRASDKAEVQRQIAEGSVDIAVGTHALLQEAVEFPKLALAVIDEQHRFGVEQRTGLQQRAVKPHLLAMSATPIPRSLALTLYGDLDLSTLRELPGGRQKIKTRWMRNARDRQAGYEIVRVEVAAGRQAFIVCPLIDFSDQIEARAATVEYENLSTGEFSDLRLGLLHGRMTLGEKQSIMARFHAGELDVLVATPVIEVGIDVANATVMMIESAERFGLSQLHQLRGRVGRGEYASHCLLMSDGAGAEARERLSIVERSSDGFELSEEDLRIRGPGDYVGTRQSGFVEFKVARLSDVELMMLAKTEALDLLADDPELEARKHSGLATLVKRSSERMTGTPS